MTFVMLQYNMSIVFKREILSDCALCVFSDVNSMGHEACFHKEKR